MTEINDAYLMLTDHDSDSVRAELQTILEPVAKKPTSESVDEALMKMKSTFPNQHKRLRRVEDFVDDEAEVSGDEEVSEDEQEVGDDQKNDWDYKDGFVIKDDADELEQEKKKEPQNFSHAAVDKMLRDQEDDLDSLLGEVDLDAISKDDYEKKPQNKMKLFPYETFNKLCDMLSFLKTVSTGPVIGTVPEIIKKLEANVRQVYNGKDHLKLAYSSIFFNELLNVIFIEAIRVFSHSEAEFRTKIDSQISLTQWNEGAKKFLTDGHKASESADNRVGKIFNSFFTGEKRFPIQVIIAKAVHCIDYARVETKASGNVKCQVSDKILSPNEPVFLIKIVSQAPGEKAKKTDHWFVSKENPLYIEFVDAIVKFAMYKKVIRNDLENWKKENKISVVESEIDTIWAYVQSKNVERLMGNIYLLYNVLKKQIDHYLAVAGPPPKA
jgi:hypothetical protein